MIQEFIMPPIPPLGIEDVRAMIYWTASHGFEITYDGRYVCSPQDVWEILQDVDAWLAKQYGVPVEVFHLWKNDEPLICCSKTKSGRKCRAIVNGGKRAGLSPQEYKNLLGGYCVFHGG